MAVHHRCLGARHQACKHLAVYCFGAACKRGKGCTLDMPTLFFEKSPMVRSLPLSSLHLPLVKLLQHTKHSA